LIPNSIGRNDARIFFSFFAHLSGSEWIDPPTDEGIGPILPNSSDEPIKTIEWLGFLIP
jgi:hypothetical protein